MCWGRGNLFTELETETPGWIYQEITTNSRANKDTKVLTNIRGEKNWR